VVDIKRWNIHKNWKEEDFQGISLEVFHNKNKAQQLAISIRSYCPASSRGMYDDNDDEVSEIWVYIIQLLSCLAWHTSLCQDGR
jgi:hypothetical protein